MSTTIGEVNINLRMSLAQFKTDTQAGTAAASKATKEMATEIKTNTREGREALELLGRSIGLEIPRGLRNIISELPGVGGALSAAFSSAVVIGLVGVVVQAIGKIKEFWESLGKLSEAEQKMFDAATKKSREDLQNRTTILKAEYDLQIAKAQGIDKDRLRVELATSTVLTLLTSSQGR